MLKVFWDKPYIGVGSGDDQVSPGPEDIRNGRHKISELFYRNMLDHFE
jgi:hypothetical protein